MDLIVFFIVVVVIPAIVAMLIQWHAKRKQLGTIRCLRCRHIGPAKGVWRPFRGMVAVCQNCDSEDWMKV